MKDSERNARVEKLQKMVGENVAIHLIQGDITYKREKLHQSGTISGGIYFSTANWSFTANSVERVDEDERIIHFK